MGVEQHAFVVCVPQATCIEIMSNSCRSDNARLHLEHMDVLTELLETTELHMGDPAVCLATLKCATALIGSF